MPELGGENFFAKIAAERARHLAQLKSGIKSTVTAGNGFIYCGQVLTFCACYRRFLNISSVKTDIFWIFFTGYYDLKKNIF